MAHLGFFIVTIQQFSIDDILPVIASSRRAAAAPVRLLADGDLFADKRMRLRRLRRLADPSQ
ncbi:MAG: hypothetical protein Q9P14_13475 [candidate division KSB1 bacterium]|nr:hypothetical protein [candidate division KSB1 bacterium]MDQ7064597.1 hypothetical protein [candidate division KSB1 bacterium]